MSSIKKDDFVKIGYTARLDDGTVIDTTDAEVAKENDIFNERTDYEDITVIVGERQVLEGLDDALEGKEVGFKGEIEVPPEKAFGIYNPDDKQYISVKKLGEKPQIGQRVELDNRYGIVERIIGRRAIIDFNHPFAGKTITFDVEIKDKIEKLEDKIDALFHIYTAKHVDVTVNDKKIRVEIPRGASIDQYFMLGKYSAINAIYKHLDIEEIEIVEIFKKDEKMAKALEEGAVSEEEKEKSTVSGSESAESLSESKDDSESKVDEKVEAVDSESTEGKSDNDSVEEKD